MRRIALSLVFFATLAAPAQAAPAQAAPAKVVLTSCEPGHRAAEFEAQMGDVPGAELLKMRFTLQVRKAGRRAYRRVAAPGFGEWTTADPGTSRYVFTRRVESLIGPARYRAMVRFRWVDASGTTIISARRYSRSCRQGDHRANLRVKELTPESRQRYVALVANTGRTASGAFAMQLAVGPTLLEPVAVDSLEPGEEAFVELFGPRCTPGSAITATADPADLIDERSEDDNALTVPCA